MSGRPKRKAQPPPVVTPKVPRKWSDEEMETLLSCLMEYGHKNLEKIHEHIPTRSIESIKTFIRTVYDKANKPGEENETNGTTDEWIDLCHSSEGPPWTDCLQIAQVFKYLSVDGLLEHHPLPTSSQGIDFGAAYKLIYQALMGYPIQPVNKPTADFVIGSIVELQNQMKKQTAGIVNVESYLQNSTQNKDSDIIQCNVVKTVAVVNEPMEEFQIKKPLRVYQRKKPSVARVEEKPTLKILIEETENNHELGSVKDFSITVEGSTSNRNKTINIPVPVPQAKSAIHKDEENLLKSSSYNPFEIPEQWLEEPLHLSLIKKN